MATTDIDTAVVDFAEVDEPSEQPPRDGGVGERVLSVARALALGLTVPIALVVLWDIAVRRGWISEFFLPRPETVVSSARNYYFETEAGRADIVSSSYRVLVGFAIAAVIGIPLGLAMGLWKTANAMLAPLLSFLKNIAPIAWIPLAIIWFGLGNKPAFFLIVIGAVFPIILNTVDGVRTVERVYLRVGQNVGASTLSLFRSVIFPGALPGIMTGLRVALGISWMIVIVAEMLAVNEGLGFRLTQAREYGWVDVVLVTMLTIGTLGFLYDRVIVLISRRMLRWHSGIDYS